MIVKTNGLVMDYGLYPVQVKICEPIQVQDAAPVVFIKNTRTSILSLEIFIKEIERESFCG